MTFDPNKPVRNEFGEARILATDGNYASGGDRYPIIAEFFGEYGWSVDYFTAEGRLYVGEENPCDLVNIPTKREGWVNIMRDSSGRVGICLYEPYPTEQEALSDRTPGCNYIATVRIEWEE